MIKISFYFYDSVNIESLALNPFLKNIKQARKHHKFNSRFKEFILCVILLYDTPKRFKSLNKIWKLRFVRVRVYTKRGLHLQLH